MNEVSEAEELAHENRRLDALRAQFPERIAEIRAARERGMSRRTLIARFGQDIVDLALAER